MITENQIAENQTKIGALKAGVSGGSIWAYAMLGRLGKAPLDT